ncbi:MAG: hypothetical protein WBB22_02895 [Anaerolineae bacterium]
MRVRHRSSMAILPLVLLGLTAAILSCAPVETRPRAWIDWPRDGFETDVGTTVTIMAHAYARGGVAEVHLAVDMQPYRVVPPDLAGEEFVEVSTEWIADEPGTYLLSVTAFDAAGGASNPASVTVNVVGDAPQLIITPGEPTDTPTSTGEPTHTPTSTGEPTDTPTSTGIPTDTPTSTPTSTATTPPRVVITMFEASKTQIMAGECPVIFTWRAEAPTAIYFDGEGVTDNPGSRDRCPESTRTYELVAEGYLGPVTASITIVVIQPPTDTEGPPAPGGLSPTGGAAVDCGAVTLSWNPASDPSGIDMYYVKVEKVTGTYKSGAWTTTDTELTIAAAWLECGQQYRWAVRAEDGAGNVGPWSSWSQFGVKLP